MSDKYHCSFKPAGAPFFLKGTKITCHKATGLWKVERHAERPDQLKRVGCGLRYTISHESRRSDCREIRHNEEMRRLLSFLGIQIVRKFEINSGQRGHLCGPESRTATVHANAASE